MQQNEKNEWSEWGYKILKNKDFQNYRRYLQLLDAIHSNAEPDHIVSTLYNTERDKNPIEEASESRNYKNNRRTAEFLRDYGYRQIVSLKIRDNFPGCPQ